jgi:RNA polymerase sigma factor (sigma-70 family)
MVAVREREGVWVVDPISTEPERSPISEGPDAFCRRMHPKLVGALRLYIGEPDIARELAQDALVRVIERWPQVSLMEHPEAWTYRVGFNLARSGLRRRRAEHRAHVRTAARPAPVTTADLADALAVRGAVAALPARQRQAVVLRYYGDLSVDQVAAAMACRPGTVKAHLHQALAGLRASGLAATGDDLDPTDRRGIAATQPTEAPA